VRLRTSLNGGVKEDEDPKNQGNLEWLVLYWAYSLG